MDGQVTWSDLGILCGKMFVAHTAATEDETSTPCWKKLRVSQNQDFLYLDCRKSGNGQKQEPLTVMGGLSLGELTTLKTGEKPSETAVQEMLSVWGPHSIAEESRLSQILEANPLPKYNLTAKACQGILRRAERRGKDLPKLLKEVLIRQSQGASPQERTEATAPTEAPTSYAVRIRGGCDGGGKGALVQTEKSGTLGTGNDQTIFTPTPINLMVATRCEALGRGTGFGVGEPGDPANTISAAHSHGVFATAIPINDKATRWQGGGESRNHDGSGNGLGIGKEGDPSPTLTAGDRHGVMCMTPWDAQSQRVYDGNGVSPTLSSRENSGLNREAVLCAGFKAGQGAQAGGIGYSEEVSPTLAAAPSGTNRTPAVVTPAVAYSFDSLSSNSMKSKNPHSGCREVDVAKTLDTTDPTPSKNQGGIAVVAPAVALDMTHACDVIRECGEQVPALQARMGTGGNQVPLTYGIGNGQANEASIMAEEVSQTLNTMHDAQAILYQPKSAMEENWAESETKNALRAGESKVSHAVVCEDVSHTIRAKANCAYRADAETYPVQNMVVRRLTPLECTRLQGYPDGWVDIGDWTDEKGKKHKDADSPKYKALGNSIALPFWDWMLRRMARYLPEGATLGSLFDGIAGYPLIWERIHGKGTARWASEIEPFPIAVTKRWFGEE